MFEKHILGLSAQLFCILVCGSDYLLQCGTVFISGQFVGQIGKIAHIFGNHFFVEGIKCM